MRATAPGKLVLSGAYAVLRGAPALVTAVDRTVFADDAQPCRYETEEVQAALDLLGESGPHPDFDPSLLREGDRKLGLGSSAAILASSLALIWWKRNATTLPPGKSIPAQVLAETLFPIALLAHQKAQGGGSGLDVAAACFGGTLSARVVQPRAVGGLPLEVRPAPLPSDLVVETWSCPQAASTAQFVKTVLSLEAEAPSLFQSTMGAQEQASVAAAQAAEEGDTPALVAALRAQVDALTALGRAAGLQIVLDEVRQLHDSLPSTACFLPSGAGGGDVTLHLGDQPSTEPFRAEARARGFDLVPLRLGAPGVRLLCA